LKNLGALFTETMKILFTADVHIKLGQKNVPVDWAKARYEKMMDQLWELQERCDIFIVGGDIFDKLPNMEELEVYFDFVASCKIPTIIFDGNHEATKRSQTFLSYLKKATHNLNPLVRVVDDYEYLVGFDLDIIPYCKLKDFEKNHSSMEFNGHILCTHVRGEIPPHVKPEVDLEIFSKWNLVLAGDLHSYDNSQRNILYPGSPVTTSFHRSHVDTGVLIVDTDTLEHVWEKIEVPQLIRKTIKAGEAMNPTEYHHTIYEVEGDMSELSGVEDNVLIDKKIVKRETDVSLILSPDLTLGEEVGEYLRYILQLNEPSVEKALKELSNYADKL
jgi:DNA repair exonuclease SbcCD nuclease subunit